MRTSVVAPIMSLVVATMSEIDPVSMPTETEPVAVLSMRSIDIEADGRAGEPVCAHCRPAAPAAGDLNVLAGRDHATEYLVAMRLNTN
jgi:hypothetical protein